MNEVCYGSPCCRVSSDPLYAPVRMEWFLIFVGGPLGIFGPILLVLLVLWAGRGNRSLWYVKAALLGLLAVLFLIMLGRL